MIARAERKERKEQAEREAEAAVDPDKASRQSGKRIFLEFQQTAALALAEAERLGQRTQRCRILRVFVGLMAVLVLMNVDVFLLLV